MCFNEMRYVSTCGKIQKEKYTLTISKTRWLYSLLILWSMEVAYFQIDPQ
jgi:hypothetical protein